MKSFTSKFIAGSIALACFGILRADAAATYDLRGYGKLAAEERDENGGKVVRITAESPAAAKVLYSKFVSDFTTLVTVREEERTVGNGKVAVLKFDGGRRLVPVWRPTESFVDIYAFPSEERLAAFLKTDVAAFQGASVLEGRAHPLYMDLWDRRNMGFWYSPGFKALTKDRTDDMDFDFMRPLLLNVNMVGGGLAAVAMRCGRDDLGYKTNVWHDVSNYAYDANPEAINVGDPDVTHLSNYYGDVPLSDNPIRRAQAADILSYLGQFTPDEHLMTVTDPHGETAAHNDVAYYGASNRDEYSRQDFIHYLRDVRKIGLEELGRRWYGDPARFARWDDVKFPRERDFYGWQDGQSQNLAGEWKWRRASREDGVKGKFFEPGFNDSKWFSYRQPGSEYLAGENKTGGWMRHSFAVDPKLRASSGPLYLTVCPLNNAPYNNPSTVYLNGQKVLEMSFGNGLEWGQADVRKLLKPQGNVLAVFTKNGNILGPVFLTGRKAFQWFPTPDPLLNARKFDLVEWVADNCARALALSAKRLRGIDPVRGIKLMAPHDNLDQVADVMEEWGLYSHCTGQGAYFRPWLKRNSYLHGVNASSEPSGSAPDVAGLKRIFFTLTMEGGNAHDYFYNLHDILISPEKKDWYEKNLPYYRLAGQFDLRKPDIAIAWSLRTNRYGVENGSSYQNDIGRGDLQQAHFGYVYGSEKDLLEGRLDDYKVIIDTNLNTLEPSEVDALAEWVKKGGTVILNQRSGRNTILEPDAWPIRKLTGCKPSVRPQEGTVTFEKTPSLLKAYAGQSFKNLGEPIDYQGRNYFSDSIALEPESPDVEVLARYQDGKAAVVVRKLGAGRVVLLGSAFYRKSTDKEGFWVGSAAQTAFLKNLLGDLGIQPLVESGQDTLWAERFIANNGSTEMLVLGNQNGRETLENASAVWTLDFSPRRIFNPATGEDLPVKIEGNKVRIDGLSIPPYELRYYAAERTDVPAQENITHWLGRQAQLWKAVPAGDPPAKPPLFWPIFVAGTFEVRQWDREADARKGMEVPLENADGWQSTFGADWASAGLRRGPELWAVYRKSFNVDPAWLKDLRGVDLIRNLQARSLWKNIRDITLNGVSIGTGTSSIPPEKILAVLKPGKNILRLLSGADADGNGGFYGDIGFRRIPGASGKVVDISKDWTAYPDEISPAKVNLPKSGDWMLVRKKVTVPRELQGREVWLEVDGSPLLASINGQLRYNSNVYGARIASRNLYLNVTPDIVFGGPNEIVFSQSNALGELSSRKMDLNAVRLVFVPRK